MGRSAYRTKAENPVTILNRDFYHSDDPTNTEADQGNTNCKRILIVEDNDLRFFADQAAKKWPLRGSLRRPAG